MKNVIEFLRQLQQNNNTVWFHEHKAEYETIRAEFIKFADGILKEIASFDPSVADLEVKDCMYRINRDIRFSQDKSPYKTHIGLFVAPGGKKSGKAGYYFHLSVGGETYPDANMVAVGHYCYEKRVVEIVREDLEDEGAVFDGFVQKGASLGMELDYEGALKKTPKGFENSPYSDYARLKSYCLQKVLSDTLMEDEEILKNHLLEIFRTTKPFLDYLNKVIDYSREED